MSTGFQNEPDEAALARGMARHPWIVRSARAALGWTQERLAAEACLSRKSVNEQEGAGRASPSQATMALASALAGVGVRFVAEPDGTYLVGAPGDRGEVLAEALASLEAVQALPGDVEAGIPWAFVLRVHAADGSWARTACWPAGTPLAALVATPSGRPLPVTVGNLGVDPARVLPENFSGMPATIAVGHAGDPYCLASAVCAVRRKDRRPLSARPVILNQES